MSDDSLRELFPSSERIAIGGSNPRGTNTVERYHNALIRYSKQTFGICCEVFRDLEIKEDFISLTSPQRLKSAKLKTKTLSKKIYSTWSILARRKLMILRCWDLRSLSQKWNGRSDRKYVLSTYWSVTVPLSFWKLVRQSKHVYTVCEGGWMSSGWHAKYGPRRYVRFHSLKT